MALSWNRLRKGSAFAWSGTLDRAIPTRSSTSRSTVQLEGAFDQRGHRGDNQPVIATDTMKNTVYAFARHDPIDHVEVFA